MVACTHRLFALMFSQVDAALPTVSTQDREDTLLHCAYTKYAVDGKEVNSHQCRVSFVSSVPLIHMRRRSRHGAATKSSELAGLYHQRHREDSRQRDLTLVCWFGFAKSVNWERRMRACTLFYAPAQTRQAGPD